MITGEVKSVTLENIKCLPEVLSELIDLILAQRMAEDGLIELNMRKFQKSNFAEPVYGKLFACC